MAEKPKGVYVPLDVLIGDDEDIIAIGMWGLALYMLGLAYAKRRKTDGCIPKDAVPRLLLSPTIEELQQLPATIDKIIERGLWTEDDDCYVIRSWAAWNPTEADRETWAARKRRSRAESNGHGDVTGPVTPKSRPEVEGKEREGKKTPKPAAPRPGESEFPAFYDTYPRKTQRRRAERAFRAALGRGAKAGDLVAAAQRLASDPNLPAERYIPYPSTWLNGDGWKDTGHPGSDDLATRLQRVRTQAGAAANG